MQKITQDVWQFPCDFPIKIVGKSSDEFTAFVFTTLHKHFPNLAENAITQRFSKDNKYLAMTVIVSATDKAQLDELYKELSANQLVMMVL